MWRFLLVSKGLSRMGTNVRSGVGRGGPTGGESRRPWQRSLSVANVDVEAALPITRIPPLSELPVSEVEVQILGNHP